MAYLCRMYANNKKIDEVLHRLNIEELNDMQLASLEHTVETKHIILLSPTGSGKTLAFLLPLIKQLQTGQQGMQALILAPARELALQIQSVFKSMQTSWTAYCCYGGHPYSEEEKYISANNPDVIIGTPGRIADHLRRNSIQPEKIRTLIVDEFDKSLEFGFEGEMEEIIIQLTNLKKRVLVSATDMEVIPVFAGLKNPVKLNFLPENAQKENFGFYKLISPSKDKIQTLYQLLCVLGEESSIVFCNHRESVERVHALLRKEGIYCEMFHGGMEQPDRERSLFKFRSGSSNVLISTDLASRGLDIPEVRHIIHYHLPVNEEAFTHRNGRTARWDAGGNSYLIITDSESLPDYLPESPEEYILPVSIPKLFKPEWTTLYIGKGKKDKISKTDILGFFYKKGNLSHTDIGLCEIKERNSFVTIRSNKVKQLLSLISGEKIKGIKTIIRPVV